jgi:hypothetical protein
VSEHFLSDEDLDLARLSWEELLAWWEHCLLQAQATNDLDEHLYSHGVFTIEPGWELASDGSTVRSGVARER